MPLKYLSNFWGSLEMPLINCKIELKLKWTKYCICLQLVMIKQMLILIVLLSLLKAQNYMFLSPLYQQKITKNYQNFLAKDLKDQFIRMNIKQKMRTKI